MSNLGVDTASANDHISLGYLYLAEEKYGEAKREFLAELEENPKCSKAYGGLFLVSVRAATFEEMTRDFLIPNDETLATYTLTKDPPELVPGLDRYRAFEVEYFYTASDIDNTVGVGTRSKESTLVRFIKREKERFLNIWENDSNIANAIEYGTLEEQYNLYKHRDRLIERFDNSISYYEEQRREAYLAADKAVTAQILEKHGQARKMADGLDNAIISSEKELNAGNFDKAYNGIIRYEKHPKAKAMMNKAVSAGQKAITMLCSGAALALALLYALITGICSTVENDAWTHFPLFVTVIFALGYAGLYLFDEKFIKNKYDVINDKGFKASDLPYFVYCITAAIATVCFDSVATVAYFGDMDAATLLRMIMFTVPMFFMALASFVGMKKQTTVVASVCFVVALLIFTTVESFTDYIGDVGFYPIIVMPLLFSAALAASPYLFISSNQKRGVFVALLASTVLEIIAAVICHVEEYPSFFIIHALIILGVESWISFKNANRSGGITYTPPEKSIDFFRVTQRFDYKITERRRAGSQGYNSDSYEEGNSGKNSGGYYSDDDDDSSSSSGSAWDFSYLSGSDSDSNNSYDAADYNARSAGFNDADDAASQTGTNSKDWYY